MMKMIKIEKEKNARNRDKEKVINAHMRIENLK